MIERPRGPLVGLLKEHVIVKPMDVATSTKTVENEHALSYVRGRQTNSGLSEEGLSMDKNEKAVLAAMKKAGKPVRPGDLAKSMTLESKEVAKAIKSLKQQGLIVSPKACYYIPADS